MHGGPIGPSDWLKLLPFEAPASSERLGWVGREAARCRAAPAFECSPPNLTHHRLLLFTRPPDEFDLRHVPLDPFVDGVSSGKRLAVKCLSIPLIPLVKCLSIPLCPFRL